MEDEPRALNARASCVSHFKSLNLLLVWLLTSQHARDTPASRGGCSRSYIRNLSSTYIFIIFIPQLYGELAASEET